MKIDKNPKTENAKIVSTNLGYEGHGIFTINIGLQTRLGNISIGNFALDKYDDEKKSRVGTELGMNTIIKILKISGVDRWEDLKGKYIRINSVGLGERVSVIGHLIDDEWFDVEDITKNFN